MTITSAEVEWMDDVNQVALRRALGSDFPRDCTDLS